MEIKNQTDTILVASATPRYVVFGLSGLWFVLLAAFGVFIKAYVFALFMALIAIPTLYFGVRWYELTIDKQAGTIVFSSWSIIMPWPQKQVVPITTITSITYRVGVETIGVASIMFNRNNGQKKIRFGNTKIHYGSSPLGAIKALVDSDVKSREQKVAKQVAQFLGIDTNTL